MKNGTVYAPRVKKAFASLRPGVNKEEAAVTDEPLDRLVLAALGSDCSDTERDRASTGSVPPWSIGTKSAFLIRRKSRLRPGFRRSTGWMYPNG